MALERWRPFSACVRPFVFVWVLPAALAFATGAFILWMVSAGYPVLDGDNLSFLPPIISYANGHELLSPFNRTLDPAGMGRLVHHGFLMQVVLARILPVGDYSYLRLALAAVQCLVLLSYVVMLMIVLRPHLARISPLARAILALSVLSLTTFCDWGRPEMFAMLLLNLGVITLALLRPGHFRALVGGIFTGLLVATDPLVGVQAGLVLALCLCVTHSGRHLLENVGLSALASVGSFLVTFFLYPYGLLDWWAGMRFHASSVVSSSGGMGPWYYLVSAPGQSFYGPLFAVALFVGVCRFARQRGARVQSPVWFGLGVFVLLAVMLRTYLGAFNRYYNLFVFAPLVLAFLFDAFFDSPPGAAARPGAWRTGAFGLLLLLTASGFLATAAVFPAYLRHGLSFEQARLALAEVRSGSTKRVCLSSGLFTLTEDYEGIGIIRGLSNHEDCETILVLQINPFKESPPAIADFAVTQNRFVSSPVTWFGLRVSASPRGYNYALYRRQAR